MTLRKTELRHEQRLQARRKMNTDCTEELKNKKEETRREATIRRTTTEDTRRQIARKKPHEEKLQGRDYEESGKDSP